MAQHLAYRQDGTFRILQLTDLHYEDGGKQDQQMLTDMQNLLLWEQPDLVFITGDFITNKDSLACIPRALAPLIAANQPFAYVFGNHDAEYGARHPALVKALASLPNCVNPASAPGIPGFSNYALELGQPGQPADWLLVGLDSHMYNKNPGVGGYDHLKPRQIAWYARQIQQRKQQNASFGALCFLHIPLVEYAQALASPQAIGQKLEAICSPAQNSGLFSTMLDLGHTRGVFCGHDHLNDACGAHHGIALCYGRAGGYSTYGRRTFKKGARIIKLTLGNTDTFTTWVRLCDGSVHNQFSSADLEKPAGK